MGPDLWLDIRQENGYINIHATKDFQKGDEALVSYQGAEAPGLFANFLAYGFVPDIVSYPLPALDPNADAAELSLTLETWVSHLGSLPDDKHVSKDDAKEHPRMTIAKKILKHERDMTLEFIGRLQQQM